MKATWIQRFGVIAACVLAAGCAQKEEASPQACADPLRGCSLKLKDKTLTVRFSTPPSALRPFSLEVSVPGASRVSARFAMVGMEMGDNTYRLTEAGGGKWRADVVLPVCVAGRSDWLVTLDVDGNKSAMAFTVVK